MSSSLDHDQKGNLENNGTKEDNNLKGIANSLDILLGKPADQWGQKEINIYHLLQMTLEKYKVRYSLSQFKLDLRDIKKNTKSCPWYQESPFRKTLNWCLEQLTIKSYQHSRKTGYFKIVCRFTQAQVRCTIVKKEKFAFLVESESTNLRTKNLNDYQKMVKIFGINANISEEKKQKVVEDLAQLIREVGMFYN